ncbi:MAG: primosomal protein N', partial [Acutalibacteraceae bacterium]
MNYLIANVAVDKATYSFDMLYSYLVPDELSEKAKPGCRVIVPFGNSKLNRQGVIYSLETRDSKARLKKITAVPDEAPLLNNEALSLALWLKEKTFCTYFDAAKVQLPTGISLKINTTYVSVSDHGVCIEDETEKKIYDFLEERREYVSADEIRERFELD